MKLVMIFWFAFTMNMLEQQVISLRQTFQRYPSTYPAGPHGHPDGNFNGQRCSCTCANNNPVLHPDTVYPDSIYPNIHQNIGSSSQHSSSFSSSSKYTKHYMKISKLLKNLQRDVANVNGQSIGPNFGFRSGGSRNSGNRILGR